jgi:thioredoxin 1
MKNLLSLVGVLIVFVLSIHSTFGAEGEILKIDKAQFKALIMDYEKNPAIWKYTGKLPCIVDFYADWCGPCKTASPILDELARKYKGQIVVYKVNTDQERELATAFGISGIPAFLWVPQNGKPSMTSGISKTAEATKEEFEKMIQDLIHKK